MTLRPYRSAGLRLRSELELPALPGSEGDVVDVTVRWGGRRPVPWQRPSAEVIAERFVDGVVWYTFCRTENGIVGRFPGAMDLEISPGGDEVCCFAAPETDPDLVSVLVTGTLSAFLLADRGTTVLHASAVEVGGRGIAFVGWSGRGKTTTAALLCAAGARLVTDDVLPLHRSVGSEAPGFACPPSARELRLRPKAATLIDAFGPGLARRPTVDGRIALQPDLAQGPLVPLGALVFPTPSRDRAAVAAHRKAASASLLELGRCQRIEGWTEGAVLAQQFGVLADLVAAVPVYEAEIPWGPPWSATVAEELVEAISLPQTAS